MSYDDSPQQGRTRAQMEYYLRSIGCDVPPRNRCCPFCDEPVNPYLLTSVVAGRDWWHTWCIDDCAATPPLTPEMIAAAKAAAVSRWRKEVPYGEALLV